MHIETFNGYIKKYLNDEFFLIETIDYYDIIGDYEILNFVHLKKYNSTDYKTIMEDLKKIIQGKNGKPDDNFYIKRFQEFEGHSIMELKVKKEIEKNILEYIKIGLDFTSLVYYGRKKILKSLPPSFGKQKFSLLFSKKPFVRTKTLNPEKIIKMIINKKFISCFNKLNITLLIEGLLNKNVSFTLKKVNSSVKWLHNSIIEKDNESAIIKTSTALEHLLILDEKENLNQSLSDRAAFILSHNRERRSELSKLFKDFYSARSSIVHGQSSKKIKPYGNLELIQKLILFMQIILVKNLDKITSIDDIRKFYINEKFGSPDEKFDRNKIDKLYTLP